MSKSLKNLNNIIKKYEHTLHPLFLEELKQWKNESIKMLQVAHTMRLDPWFRGKSPDMEKIIKRDLAQQVANELVKHTVVEKRHEECPDMYGFFQDIFVAKAFVLLDKEDEV